MLVASRMQVISRSASGKDERSGLASDPGTTSRSASGRSADGKAL